MKTVYKLISNGWVNYYKTENARRKDYVTQDAEMDLEVSDEEYEQFEFEEDKTGIIETPAIDPRTVLKKVVRIGYEAKIPVNSGNSMISEIRYADITLPYDFQCSPDTLDSWLAENDKYRYQVIRANNIISWSTWGR